MNQKIPFENEYALHNLTQNHLKELFGLEFVASEIQLDGLRLDNLAFDTKNDTFVIIEYKNELDLNVLNQAQKYCDLVKSNEKFFTGLLKADNEINFDNTQVMIIAPEFTKSQMEEQDNFELWKVALFNDGTVTYENINTNEIKTINVNLDEYKLTEETLLEDKSEDIVKLYTDFNNKLLNEFDDLDMKFLVDAVSIKAHNEFICIVNVKNSVKIHYYTEKLEDPKNKTRDISDITTGGPLSNYELTLNQENIDYAIDLIKQVYAQKVKK